MQVIPCILLFFVAGASGETDGCLDSTSLLQRSLNRHDGTGEAENCPCILGKWSDWTDCTVSCGGGTKTRSRKVEKNATGTGSCGNTTESEKCQSECCPVDCVMTDWSNWAHCSASCGVSTRTRTIEIKIKDMCGGKECPEEKKWEEEQDCTPNCVPPDDDNCKYNPPCPPTPCEWQAWGDWSNCPVSCGGGERTRTRKCSCAHATDPDEICVEDNAKDTKKCNKHCCPVDCVLAKWSEWGDCEGECGQGTKQRKREISVEPECGGQSCGEQDNSTDCVPPPPNNTACDCEWDDWGEWNGCTVSCGTGTKSRSRGIGKHAKMGGENCTGNATQILNCTEPHCPTDCDCVWTDWGPCSTSCPGGHRTRECGPGSTEPAYGGKPCPVSPESNETGCPDPDPVPTVCCKWGDWTPWSPCSKSCEEGTKSRSRESIGKCEQKNETEHDPCIELECCPEDCEEGPWSEWSDTCPHATSHCEPDWQPKPGHSRTRTREVYEQAKCGGIKCDPRQTEPCPTISTTTCPPPPCVCEYGDWSDWEGCPVCSNEKGEKEKRTRDTKNDCGTPEKCDDTSESRSCDPLPCCPVDCTWNDWTKWSDCTATCDGGTQRRTRSKKTEASCKGKCGKSEEDRPCNTQDCPKCCWHDWSDWACSGEKEEMRTRKVDLEGSESINASTECPPENQTQETERCTTPTTTTTDGQNNPDDHETTTTSTTTTLPDFVTVCGKVINVKNKEGVDAATVTIQEQPGPTAESDSSGDFCIENVDWKKAKIFNGTKVGWVDSSGEMPDKTPEDGKISGVVIYMSQELPVTDWRIVLTWGNAPLDLDARTSIGSNCLVSYQKNQRSVTCDKGIKAKLDLDHCFYTEPDTTAGKYTCSAEYSPGGPSVQASPETTTITNVDADELDDDWEIVFHVSNYMVCKNYQKGGGTVTNSATQTSLCPGEGEAGGYDTHYPVNETGTVEDSSAEVKVFHGDKQVAHFKLANGDGELRYIDTAYPQVPYTEWWVFSINKQNVQTSTVTELKG